MTENKRTSLTRKEEELLDDALAALLASTRRNKRSLDLLEVSSKLATALKLMGSLRVVADTLGLSDETVRQFTRIGKLSPDVRRLIKSGQITGMDLADRLSRLPVADQYPVAASVVSGALDARDVRALLPLRKEIPNESIHKLIRRIQTSRNIREYVAEFVTPHPTPTSATLAKRLSPVIAKGDIRDLELITGIGRVVLTAGGKKALESVARKRKMTKRQLLQRLVDGKVA